MIHRADLQLVPDISGQNIRPIFEDQAVEKEGGGRRNVFFFDYFTLGDGIDMLSRNFGN